MLDMLFLTLTFRRSYYLKLIDGCSCSNSVSESAITFSLNAGFNHMIQVSWQPNT